jgi:hypothetical protein
MNVNRYLGPVGKASAALFLASAALSGLTLAAFALLAVLVFQGRIDTQLLASLAAKAQAAGFVFLAIFLALGGGLEVFCKRAQIPMRIKGQYAWKAVWIICLVVFLHVFLTPSRYVHAEGNKWISTGRAGPWAVSEQVARRYLWSEVEWSFLIIFGGSSLIALTTRSIAQDARSAARASGSSEVKLMS